jgi:hypothetical protein
MKTGSTSEKARIVKSVAVAVEGLDYFHTLLSQIKDDPRLQEVQLWNFKEAPHGDLRRWLKVFTTLDGFRDKVRAIGVIQDAEKDAACSFQGAAQALTDTGFTRPTESMKVTTGNPTVGVLIVPHNTPSGCLEHAMLEARRPDLPLNCAEEYLRCVGSGKDNDNWRAKVKVHALIAAGANPAWTLSQSVAGGMWDTASPSLQIMIDFMRLLCTDPTDNGIRDL